MGKAAKQAEKHANSWVASVPYDQLPPLPPEAELETRAVLKQCITARAAVAELKRAAELIPNQAMLINTLPLLEAQASSEIENIVTTTDTLFRFRQTNSGTDDEANSDADPATKEALRYSRSLLEGFGSLAALPLSTRTAEQVCSRIKGEAMSVRRVLGTALARDSGEVVYTPPQGESRLRDLLANWETFLHNAIDIDPLVRMAVGHYQFEAIHPFTDGNGRTGRVLNSLFLIEQQLLTLPIMYLSRYIIQNRSEYYQLLLAVTRDDAWEPWILYMLRGIEETALWTTSKIEAIRKLSDHTTAYVRDHATPAYSHELVNLIFELPYCRIQNLVDAKIAERQTASRYLRQLVEIGVLADQTVGREKLFLHPKLLQLLTRDSNDFVLYG